MSILKIAQLGNPVLRRKAEPVPVDQIISHAVQTFIDSMVETKDEYNGAGLAAPQVHKPLQIIVAGGMESPRYEGEDALPLMVLVNPRIASFSEAMEEDWEGCLSVAELWGIVRRAKSVVVEAYDRNGENARIEASGFAARVLQHEIDHLHGKVFLDRMADMKSLAFTREYMRYVRAANEPED